MASLEEIYAKLGDYVDDSLSLDEFEDWFLANTWNSHLYSDEETVKVVHHIEGNLLDFSAGAIAENTLRRKLALVVRSFASSNKPKLSFGPLQPHVFSETRNITLGFSAKPISEEYLLDSVVPLAGSVQVDRLAYQV